MRIVSCTRAEAEAELANIVAGGPEHFGHEEFAAAARYALAAVRLGRKSALVGHTIYRIQEAQAS